MFAISATTTDASFVFHAQRCVNPAQTHHKMSKDGDGGVVDEKSLQASIDAGHKAYALRDYESAASSYGRASEMMAAKNGDADEANADILFYYGRALYQCAVMSSDVLGNGSGAAAGKEGNGEEKRQKSEANGGALNEASKDVISDAALAKSPEKKKGVFEFLGDDDEEGEGEDEEEEGESDGGGDGEGEVEDDFTVAWEILDLARVLLERRIEKPSGDEPLLRKDKERLSEVFDYLGEVSLESENFPQSVTDLTSSLNLKTTLFPADSTVLSEAYFKLALALEFSGEVDAKQRAAEYIRQAIRSCELRMERETSNGKGKEKENREVENARELVGELQARLKELTAALDAPCPLVDPLQEILGETADDVRSRIVSAMGSANDVSNLIRKKAKADSEPSAKRVKLDDEA